MNRAWQRGRCRWGRRRRYIPASKIQILHLSSDALVRRRRIKHLLDPWLFSWYSTHTSGRALALETVRNGTRQRTLPPNQPNAPLSDSNLCLWPLHPGRRRRPQLAGDRLPKGIPYLVTCIGNDIQKVEAWFAGRTRVSEREEGVTVSMRSEDERPSGCSRDDRGGSDVAMKSSDPIRPSSVCQAAMRRYIGTYACTRAFRKR